MKLLGIAVAVSIFTGCYAPSFKDCELACSGTGADSCPAGLTCSTGMCRPAGMTGACRPTDAGPCWPFAPSNVDPCELGFPASEGPLSLLAGGAQTIDTTNPVLGMPYLAGRVVVLHVDSLNVESGATLTVSGDRPLIIASDGDVNVNGVILVESTATVPVDCSVTAARMGTAVGAGGGGGGYGTLGGNGGGTVNTTVGATAGGIVAGLPMLVPLRGGCPGGGGAGPTTAGSGGSGGGALQITTRTEIIVAAGGTIVAGGDGGGGGKAASCGGTSCTSGGGGGGTGGSILLEGERVEIRQMGRVCAVGGAGGNGPRSSAPIASGASGGDAMFCMGGVPGNIGLNGGRGADLADVPGAAGTSGANNIDSGAGGGGGLGRIRIRAITRLLNGNVIPAPAS